jgi:hypothetical protein
MALVELQQVLAHPVVEAHHQRLFPAAMVGVGISRVVSAKRVNQLITLHDQLAGEHFRVVSTWVKDHRTNVAGTLHLRVEPLSE